MNEEVLKVLAVEDPAVLVYVDDKKNILKNFPGKVEIQVIPWASYYKTMQAVFAGEADYDIVMIAGHLWKRDIVEKGYLAEVKMDEEDILKTVIKEMNYKGATYLSPSFCDGHMIVYRKSIIKELLGYELSDVIAPEEYIEIAKKLHDYGYKIAMKADKSEIFTDALPFLRMNGIDVYDAQTGNVQCDRKEIIDGLEKYCELRKFAFMDTEKYGNAEIVEKIQTKEAAMAVTWSGQLGVVFNEYCQDKEDLGVATFTTAWNVTWSFAISNSSKKKNLANEFLKYLRSKEVDQMAGSCSGAPIRTSSYLIGKELYPWYRCQMHMIEHATGLPDLAQAGDKNGVLYEEIYEAFIGKKTAREAMKEAMIKIRRVEG